MKYLLVFAFFIVSACSNSCQKSIGTMEAVKVEASTVVTIKGTDYNVSDIVINPDCPINQTGILKDGKVTVREIVCHSNTVKENQIIAGILYITGEAIDNKAIDSKSIK